MNHPKPTAIIYDLSVSPGSKLRDVSAVGFTEDETVVVSKEDSGPPIVFTFPTKQYPKIYPRDTKNQSMEISTKDHVGHLKGCFPNVDSSSFDVRVYVPSGVHHMMEVNRCYQVSAIEYETNTADIWLKHDDGFYSHTLKGDIVDMLQSKILLAKEDPYRYDFIIIDDNVYRAPDFRPRD